MQTVQCQVESSTLELNETLVTESGGILQNPRIHYTTYGSLNADKSNAVWVFHALTANSDPTEWWPGIVRTNSILNPDDYFIVCANMLGSCYGSSEPVDFHFPLITIRDMIEANKKLLGHLGIERIKIGIGGSMGGQQLLEWAVQEPDLFEMVVSIATNAIHSPWGIAFNESQRIALMQPDLKKGLAAARSIAMLSYRHYEAYRQTQFDDDGRIDEFSASSYQRYQGEKLRNRFSPYSYWYLSKAMDSHNIGRRYATPEMALSRIKSRGVVIGITTDMLFPIKEQAFIAEHLMNASFYSIDSDYGHDGFLVEAEQIARILEQEIK